MRKSFFLFLQMIFTAALLGCGDNHGSGTSGENSPQDESYIHYGSLIDERDGQSYKTVTIGSQVWMAENLNYAYKVPTTDLDSSSFCYSGNADNCKKYGRLYLWSAAMDSAAIFSTTGEGCGYGVVCHFSLSEEVRGVCPEGWHLPNDGEWNTLFMTAGGSMGISGSVLKSTEGWRCCKESGGEGNGLDSLGFSALSAGYYSSYSGKYYDKGEIAWFWSSYEDDIDYSFTWGPNENDSVSAYYWSIDYIDDMRREYDGSKWLALSVRCIMNSSEDITSSNSNGKSSSSIAEGYTGSYGQLIDERDGQSYKTVTIGSQVWMAENLNYAYKVPTADLDSSSFCYDDEASNCEKYGRLYLWSAAMDSAAEFSLAGKGCGYGKKCNPSGVVRGVCPKGWHMPNDDEWKTLFSSVGGENSAGLMLKSTDGWHKNYGEDRFGFAALPAGSRYCDPEFTGEILECNYGSEGLYAAFESSSEINDKTSYTRWFMYLWDDEYRHSIRKHYGMSVRCVQD